MVFAMAPIIPLPLHLVSPQSQGQGNPTISTKSTRTQVTLALSPKMSMAPAASSFSENSPGASSHSNQPAKMEPFNRSRISRMMREPSFLEKAEHALEDRCMSLEGEDAYRCWEALFEFENVKEECEVQCDTAPSSERSKACRPLERFENMVRQSNGVFSLIENVRMVAKTSKIHNTSKVLVQDDIEETVQQIDDSDKDESQVKKPFPEPGGLPPTEEDLELEKGALMPDSSFTRVLRRRGRESPWYTHPADFETD